MFACTILTLFPAMFPGPLGQSLAGDALARGLWSLETRDIREHGLGRHRAVDDTPAGGGPGMVMRADVIAASLDAAVAADDPRPRLIMSPRGQPFSQAHAREWAAGPGLVIVCPRFEGVDERVIEARGLIEVSIGDYVLSGGEIAALADARRLRAAHSRRDGQGRVGRGGELRKRPARISALSPARANGRAAPSRTCLLSGDHAKIAAWRRAEAERITRERRPDLTQL